MKISPEIELLPIEDKLQLVNDLWDSIQHQSIPINTDQMKETQKESNVLIQAKQIFILGKMLKMN